MRPAFNLWVRNALESFHLIQCACCGLSLESKPRKGHSSRWVCKECETLINLDNRVHCIQCGLKLGTRPQAFGWTQCRHCRANPNPHIRTTVVQDYFPPFSNWILALKYAGNPAKAQLLGDFLLDKIASESHTLPDVLVPSPISNNRLKQRGYNQAELIARHLGKNLKIPVATNWLKKVKDTAQQANSSKAEREQNLHNAIICTQHMPGSIKIGLVDDVITTGSTLNTCAHVLQKAGAKHFQFYAICRTPE